MLISDPGTTLSGQIVWINFPSRMTHNENLEPSSRNIYQQLIRPIKRSLLVEEDCRFGQLNNRIILPRVGIKFVQLEKVAQAYLKKITLGSIFCEMIEVNRQKVRK